MARAKAAGVGVEIVGALVLYIAGRNLLIVHAVERVWSRQQIEPRVMRFARQPLSVALNITPVVAISGFFGVPATAFTARTPAARGAVGTAWAGPMAISLRARSSRCCVRSRSAILFRQEE